MRPYLTIPEATFEGIIASGKVNTDKSAFDQPNPVWLVVNFTVTDQPVSFRIKNPWSHWCRSVASFLASWKVLAVTWSTKGVVVQTHQTVPMRIGKMCRLKWNPFSIWLFKWKDRGNFICSSVRNAQVSISNVTAHMSCGNVRICIHLLGDVPAKIQSARLQRWDIPWIVQEEYSNRPWIRGLKIENQEPSCGSNPQYS